MAIMAVRCFCVSGLEDRGMAFFNLHLGVSPLLATQNTAATIPLSTLGPSEYMCSLRRTHCININPCSLLAVASITCTAFSAVVKIHSEEFSSQFFVFVVSQSQFFRLLTMRTVCSELCGLSSTTRTLFSCFKKNLFVLLCDRNFIHGWL